MARLPPGVQVEVDKLNDFNKKQEEQIMSLETKAIQLINLYFVFQGVILSSISSTSPVKCRYWWIPFCLSLFASIFNFIIVFNTITYFLKCSEELDQSYEDVQRLKEENAIGEPVNNNPPHTDVVPQPEPRQNTTQSTPDTLKKRKRRFICYAAMVSLLGLSGILLYGCSKLVCDNSQQRDKCVKLC